MVFCCGCTLRFSTQFLLWTELMIDCSWFLYSVLAIIFYIRNIEDPYFKYYYGYYILWSFIGIVTTVLGLWAIKKEKPSFLNGFLCYLQYYLCFEICCAIILIIRPSLYNEIFHHTLRNMCYLIHLNTSLIRNVILIALWYLFVIANLFYFVIVVKTYRDHMRETEPTDDTLELEKLSMYRLKLKTMMKRDSTITV